MIKTWGVLAAWWMMASLLAVWNMWGAPPLLIAVPLVAATAFVVLLLCCRPQRTWARAGVYLSALLANQAPALTGAAWVLLPGHHQHKIAATALGLIGESACAVLALATFVLVRRWVTGGRRWPRPARGRPGLSLASWAPWWPVLGTGALVAAIYLLVLSWSDFVKDFGYRLFDMDSTPFPSAGGGFGAWLLEASSGGLAGAVEEPVFVGLLVLLWPRLRWRTFVPLALLSGVARAGIHLYYAAGVADVGAAVAVILVWCVLWSAVALLLIYKTRMLWPVIVAHGLKDVLAAMAGPFTADGTPLHIAVVALPFVALTVIFVVGGVRLFEMVLAWVSRRWPRVGRWLSGPREATT
ncbi:MAG: CPBP family intramembrane metalloprotease [Mycobacterium sp.]|nr:MAG: CPBP family intramembrane metalloprotease [Mycobacterium sp.]